MTTLQAMCAVEALAILAIGATLYLSHLSGKRVHRKMQAQHGSTGHTRPWTGAGDGRQWCYELATGKIVPARPGPYAITRGV